MIFPLKETGGLPNFQTISWKNPHNLWKINSYQKSTVVFPPICWPFTGHVTQAVPLQLRGPRLTQAATIGPEPVRQEVAIELLAPEENDRENHSVVETRRKLRYTVYTETMWFTLKYLPAYLSINPSIHLSSFPRVHPSTYISIHL